MRFTTIWAFSETNNFVSFIAKLNYLSICLSPLKYFTDVVPKVHMLH